MGITTRRQDAAGTGAGQWPGPIGRAVEVGERWSYEEIETIPPGGVPGHAGELVAGTLFGAPVLVARGRRHLYEGHNGVAVGAIVRELHRRGVRRLLLTNAAGCLRADWEVDEWMVIADQLNLTGTSPLSGPQFVDCSALYPEALREDLHAAADEIGLRLREGHYAGLRGPQYETPAEIVMLRRLGADAVGMSTVLEAIQARALGMEVIGLSCLTNDAAGLSGTLAHDEVAEVGRGAARELGRLLERVLS